MMADYIYDNDLAGKVLRDNCLYDLGLADENYERIIPTDLRFPGRNNSYNPVKTAIAYMKFLCDHGMMEVNKSPGKTVYSVSSKGRLVVNNGGFVKYLEDEKAAKEKEIQLQQRTLKATEDSSLAAKDSGKAAWVSAVIGLASLAIAIFQYWQNDQLESRVKILERALSAKKITTPNFNTIYLTADSLRLKAKN